MYIIIADHNKTELNYMKKSMNSSLEIYELQIVV